MQITSAFIGTLTVGSTELDVQALIAQWIADHTYAATDAVILQRTTNPVMPDKSASNQGGGGENSIFGPYLQGPLSRQYIFGAGGRLMGWFQAYYNDDGITFFWQKYYDGIHGGEFGNNIYPVNNSSVAQEIFHGGDCIRICFGPCNGNGSNREFDIAPFGETQDTIVVRRVAESTDPEAVPYDYFTTSTGTVHFDDVRTITCSVGQQYSDTNSVGQCLLTWDQIGFSKADLEAEQEVRMDFAFTYADGTGSLPVQVRWWNSTGAGPSATVDIPTEARLYPEVWGTANPYTTDPYIVTALRPSLEDSAALVGPGVEISVTLAETQRITVNIEEVAGNDRGVPDGWVVRELIRAKEFAAGTHTFYWNGRDRLGNPMPGGSYRARVGTFTNFGVEFYASAMTSARPPWRTADGLGSFGGVHGGVWYVAADTTGIYLGNSGEEGSAALRKINADGEALWTASLGVFGVAECLVVDEANSRLYVVIDSPNLVNAKLRAINSTTGGTVWEINFSGFFDHSAVSRNTKPYGGALIGGTLYFSSPEQTSLITVDVTTQAVSSLAVGVAMSGMCAFDSTHLLACTGDKIIKVDVTDGSYVDFKTGLGKPEAVMMDGADYWVSDCHYTKNQVYKFNASHVLQTTIGVLGGQTLGLDLINPPTQDYDPLKLGNISAIAKGPDGYLYLAGRAVCPRRYAVVTTAGVHVKDIFGPGAFAATGFYRNNPDKIICSGTNGFAPNFVECTIDPTADPLVEDMFTVNRIIHLSQNGVDETEATDLIYGSEGILSGSGYAKLTWVKYDGPEAGGYTDGNPAGTNGREYLFIYSSSRAAFLTWTGSYWKPCCVIPSVFQTSNDFSVPAARQAWYDADGDGLVDVGEYATARVYPTGGFQTIKSDLTMFGDGGLFAPSSISADGVPNFEPGVYTPYAAGLEETYHLYRESYFDSTGILPYGESNAGDDRVWIRNNFGPQRNVTFHDDSSGTNLGLIKDGELKFMVGVHDSYMLNEDVTSSIVALSGEVDGVVLYTDWNSIIGGYTDKGMSLGWCVKPDVVNGAIGSDALYIENFQTGTFLKHPVSGKRIAIYASTEDVRLFEVTGAWDGDYVETTQSITLPSALPISGVTPTNARIDYSSWGLLSNTWVYLVGLDRFGMARSDNVSSINIMHPTTGDLVATIKMGRDAGQLWIFASVTTSLSAWPGNPSPEATASQFGTQSGIELMFGLADNPERTTAQQGDTRVFLTTQGSMNSNMMYVGVATMCRPASTDVTATSEMRYANDGFLGGEPLGEWGGTAPTGTLDFSAMAEVPNSRVAASQRYGNAGFNVHGEIPLAYLVDFIESREVSVIRPAGDGDGNFVDTRPDLKNDLILCNVAVQIGKDDGTVERYSWKPDTNPGTDPTVMNPSEWGTANGPLEYMLDENGDGVSDY